MPDPPASKGNSTPEPQDPAATAAALAKAQAEAANAAADARAAEAKAKKAEREEAEASGAAAANQRAAETAKATAEAEKAAAAARQAQIAALIPNFGEIKTGSIEVKDGQPLFGAVLAGRALNHAAARAAADLKVPAGARVLVTSDPDLATSDAAYQNVSTGLEELVKYADLLLADTDPSKPRKQSFTAVAGAVAGALPGLLSLFAAKSTVTSGTVKISDTAGAAAVIGQLKDVVAFHDDFRLVPDGPIKTQFDKLTEDQRKLAARKLELGTERASAAADQAAITDRIATLTKGLADGTADKDTALAELETERETLADQRVAVDLATTNLEVVTAALTAIETFVGAITSVPEGAKRSPMVEAALHQQLHPAKDADGKVGADAITHVLLAQAQDASLSQVVDDKPLWFKDRFTLVATVTITYMLLAVDTGAIVAAGNANGVVHGRGSIGKTLDLTVIADGSRSTSQ
jgi:hypothetical protein